MYVFICIVHTFSPVFFSIKQRIKITPQFLQFVFKKTRSAVTFRSVNLALYQKFSRKFPSFVIYDRLIIDNQSLT